MKRYNVINGALSFINPFLGLLSSIFDIIKLRDASLFFAFSLALIAVYFPLMYDTSANFFNFYYPNEKSLTSLYLMIPIFLKEKFGIDFYYFIFANVLFVSYVWSKIILTIFSEYKGKYVSIFIFILLLFTFNYRDLMDINRSIFAFSWFFYYIFLIKNKNFLKFLIFSTMAAFFHSSSLIIIFLYLISLVQVGYRFNFFILCIAIFIGVFLPNLIFNFESLLVKLPLIGDSLGFYIYGERFGVQNFSTGTLLKKLLNSFFVFITCLFAIYSIKKNGKDRILQFLVFLGCFELCFLGFVTFFERINLAFNFLFLYVLIKNIGLLNKCFLVFLVFFRSLVLYIFIYIPIFVGEHALVMDVNVKNEIILKPFYYPTVFLLDIHNNGYSDELIDRYSLWRD